MKELIKEVVGVKGTPRLAIICAITSIIYSVIDVVTISWIGKAVGQTSINGAVRYIFYIVIGYVISIVSGYTVKVIQTSLKHISFTEFNNRLSKKLADVDYSFFEEYSTSHITTVNGTLFSIAAVYDVMISLLNNILQITSTIVAVCIINGYTIIPMIIVYIIGIFLSKKLFKVIKKLDDNLDNEKHVRNKEAQMLISGFSDVRTMCTQETHINNIINFNKSIKGVAIKKSKMLGLCVALCEGLNGAFMVLFMIIAVILIRNEVMDRTVAMSLLMYVWNLTYPLVNSIDMAGYFSETLPGYLKYKTMMNYKNKVLEGDISLDEAIDTISISNVSFSYNSSETVLNNVSFKIHRGEKIGICGTSGEGKSTLLKLLNRFYDPNDGEISVDGIDIRHLTLNSLRKHIGTVSQKIYIFEGTIKENIAYGNKNASEYDIIEASKKACLYDFIQSLPDKFNTNIGVDGLKLSGGQQQRIALARIFLSDPEIILLDEATSALDNESEAIIQKSLLDECEDKTIIAVAHRLSTIRNFDRIIVLNNHTIAEVGSHEELVEMNGIYASLVKANK